MNVVKSVSLFIAAGLCEIGGGYLVWLSVRGGKPCWYGVLGGAVLIIYGLIPTLQENNFGRTYASYGGFFIAMSLLWAWKVDGFRPDKYDLIGALIALIGVCVIFYTPRSRGV